MQRLPILLLLLSLPAWGQSPATPNAKPAATLDSVAVAWSSSSPVRARSAKV